MEAALKGNFDGIAFSLKRRLFLSFSAGSKFFVGLLKFTADVMFYLLGKLPCNSRR